MILESDNESRGIAPRLRSVQFSPGQLLYLDPWTRLQQRDAPTVSQPGLREETRSVFCYNDQNIQTCFCEISSL